MTIDEQIAKVASKLSELKAKKVQTNRKERNGELMAIGIGIENQFGNAPDSVKEWLTKAAEAQTDERTKKRFLAAIERFRGSQN